MKNGKFHIFQVSCEARGHNIWVQDDLSDIFVLIEVLNKLDFVLIKRIYQIK